MRRLTLISFTIVMLVQIYSLAPQQFKINLDLSPELRYKQVAILKKEGINKFIDYLYTTQKYQLAFKIANKLSLLLKKFVGDEFYRECKGIAHVIGRKVSELVVFNYMYELGSYSKFCTSITVQINHGDYFLGRNLDYGFQQFLSENSLIFTYIKRGKPIYQTIGHAGLIGAHTGIRFDGYSITFNERIDGGFHKTLEQMVLYRAETMPYLIQKILREYEIVQEAQKHLIKTRSCAAAYIILNSRDRNVVIEKERVGVKARYEEDCYLVQTNTDREKVDPDGRRIVAERKMEKLRIDKKILREEVYNILSASPNKNNLTTITAILDTSNNRINATIWK